MALAPVPVFTQLTSAELALIQELAALGDPGADRILFWDESENAYGFLEAGAGLTITGTTMTASGSGVSFGADNQIPYTNATTDDFDYTAGFTFDGTDFAAPGDVSVGDDLLLQSSGAIINFGSGDVTLTYTANTLTLAGGTLALGTNSITMTGSIAATGARVTKGWFTDIESTNAPTVSGAAVYYVGGTDVALADGGTGASLADPGADRILFWDDSGGAVTWLTVGAGLTITDTEITASGSATAWDDIGDPDGDTTIAFAGFKTVFTSTLDAAGEAVMTISNTDADLANATTLFRLQYVDDGQANAIFLQCVDDSAGTPNTVFQVGADGAITTDTGITVTTNITFAADATSDIGTSTVGVNDIHFGSGGILNFDGGDVTITHSANLLTLAGGNFDLTANNLITGGQVILDVDGSGANAAGSITFGAGNDAGIFFNGTDLVIITDGAGASGIIFDSEDDTYEWRASGTAEMLLNTTALTPNANDGLALGSTSLGWSDVHLATGGVINWANGEVTITETDANTLTVAGATAVSLGTSAAFTTGTIELGAASDTTLARVSAGVVSIEGVNILTVAGGTLTGSITLGENTSIALDPAGSADGKYTGITIAGTAGATLAFGDLVYLAAADSRWELADADAASTSDRMMGMVVLAAAADGDPTVILLVGQIRADAAFPALTIGSAVYVGETAGDIQVAIPTGADNVIRRVGYALTADEIYFNPSMDSQTTVA